MKKDVYTTKGKHVKNVLVLTIVAMIVYIGSAILINAVLGITPEMAEDSESNAMLRILFSVFANTLVVYWYVQKGIGKWMFLRTWSAIFSIQFFLTQIETLWFNDAVDMPSQIIASVLITGFLYSLLMSLVFSRWNMTSTVPMVKVDLWKILLFGALIYPLIYHTAGYFIAWQFESLREYYTGSVDKQGYFQNLTGFLLSSLYVFQIVRGAFWAFLGYFIAQGLRINARNTPWIVGCLFAVLMSSQLLIPNAYMPENIRLIHLLEVGISNFIWGVVTVFIIRKFTVMTSTLERKVMSDDKTRC